MTSRIASTRRLRSSAAIAVVLGLLVIACSSEAPTPTPPGLPSPSGPVPASSAATAGPTASDQAAGPGRTGAPDAPELPRGAGPLALIRGAEARGEIDHATALLYRIYATFRDERLPAEYAGDAADAGTEQVHDLGAIREAATRLDDLPTAIAREIRPFVVRPSDPTSVFSAAATTASTILGRGVRGAATTAVGSRASMTRTAACGLGEWLFEDGSHPFRVWYQCGADQQIEATVTAQLLDELWDAETDYLRDPRPDGGTADEGGTDAIDVYIADTCKIRARECHGPTGNAVAIAIPAPPNVGDPGRQGSSGFIVVGRANIGTNARLYKSTLAHELFHVLQFATNVDATFDGSGEAHWFIEASAAWSEWAFVPEAVADTTVPWYGGFRTSSYGLQATVDGNQYSSFAWPLFMEQEAGRDAVARAWTGISGVTSFDAVNGAIGAIVPFAGRFRDFAVRAWNKPLDRAVGTLFPLPPTGDPRGEPGDPRRGPNELYLPIPPGAEPLVFTELLGSLYSAYRPFTVGDGVRQITVDFNGLKPTEALDVDVLLKIRNKGWERRKLRPGPTRWCLDRPADAIEEGIFVLSHHDPNPDTRIFGDWTVEALEATCALVQGTLTFTRVSSYEEDEPGLPDEMHSERTTVTLGVMLRADSAGLPDPTIVALVDNVDPVRPRREDSSRYKVSASTLAAREMGDCTSTFATKTDGAWRFLDTPTDPGDINYVGGYLDLVGGQMLLSVVVHYPYEVTEDSCSFGAPQPNVGTHDVLGCTNSFGIDGEIEENDGSPDWIFVDCHGVGPAMGYDRQEITIRGTLRFFDEPDPGTAR